MKQTIDTIADKHISDIKDVLHKCKSSFEESHADSHNRTQKLRDLVNENVEVLKSENKILLFDVAKELKRFNVDIPNFKSLPEPKFDSDVLEDEKLVRQAFGCITNTLDKNTNGTEYAESVEPQQNSDQTKEAIEYRDVVEPDEINSELANESQIKQETAILIDITDEADIVIDDEQSNFEGAVSAQFDTDTGNVSQSHFEDAVSAQFDTDTGHVSKSHQLLQHSVTNMVVDTLNILPTSMAVTSNGNVYFIEEDSSILYLMQENVSPAIFTEISLGKSYINDIAVNTLNEEICCILRSDKSICRMDMDTGKLTKMFTAAGKPKCLDFTKDNTIVIGDSTKPLLTIYKYTGDKLQSLTYDGESPYHLTVCRLTGKVAVACTSSKVLVLDSNLEKLYQYDGPPSGGLKPDHYDLKFDCHGFLLIVDHKKGVRVINAENGHHQRTFKSTKKNQLYTSLFLSDKDVIVAVGISKHGDENIHNPFQLLTMKYIA